MNPLAVLRGLVLNPVLVAFARGLVEMMAFAALLVAYEVLTSSDLPNELQPYGGVLILGLRVLEGLADKIDPAKKRRRDTLRGAATDAADGASYPLQPGDVAG